VTYPEPIPVLKGKDAQEFDSRLKKFKLNASQKEFYREARRLFKNEQ